MEGIYLRELHYDSIYVDKCHKITVRSQLSFITRILNGRKGTPPSARAAASTGHHQTSQNNLLYLDVESETRNEKSCNNL